MRVLTSQPLGTKCFLGSAPESQTVAQVPVTLAYQHPALKNGETSEAPITMQARAPVASLQFRIISPRTANTQLVSSPATKERTACDTRVNGEMWCLVTGLNKQPIPPSFASTLRVTASGDIPRNSVKVELMAAASPEGREVQ